MAPIDARQALAVGLGSIVAERCHRWVKRQSRSAHIEAPEGATWIFDAGRQSSLVEERLSSHSERMRGIPASGDIRDAAAKAEAGISPAYSRWHDKVT
jgi:hypothetical protein